MDFDGRNKCNYIPKKIKKLDLIFLYIRYHVIYTPLYKLQSQVTSDKETNKKKLNIRKCLTYVYSIKIIVLEKNLNINSQKIYISHLEGLISRINNIINLTKIPHK